MAVLEGRQSPVVHIETIHDVQSIATGNGLLHAKRVKTERQVHKGRDLTDHANVNADPCQRREGNRNRSQDLVEHEIELQQRQLIGEQSRAATAENLGPSANVGQVRHELQATAGRARTAAARGLRLDTRDGLHQFCVDARGARRGAIALDKAHIVGAQAIDAAQGHA